jgi:hypothetical protein
METAVPDVVRVRPINPAMLGEARNALELASVIKIDGPEMYELAADQLKDVKSLAKRLDDERKAITGPLDQAKKAVMDLFRAPVEFCEKAERTIKQSMLTYDDEQRRLQAEAERKAREAEEAERRRIAEEARRKAEAEAAEVRRQAEERAAVERKEAAERAAQAKARGDAEAAERAEREGKLRETQLREQAEREAAMRSAEIEAAAQQESEQVAVYAAPAEVVKADGVSYRDNWKAEVISVEAVIAAAMAGDQMARSLLAVDTKAMTAQAKALKERFKVPGIRVFNDRTVASKRS